MLRTALCNLLNIRYPIIQGGMAHIGTWELVSAVSNAGGLGIIGAGFYEADWVRQQLQTTKEKTGKPYGINIQLASPHLEQVIEVVLEEKPPVVTTGAGNPEPYLPALKHSGIKVLPVVNSADAARKAESAGADAVIAEGTESGGHVGETTTVVLVPEVAGKVGIPVIAAGGIYNGRGLAAALALGAAGIQMGTRFACSTECIAHDNYKNEICRSTDPATIVTRQALGYPQRSLRNSLAFRFNELEKAGVPAEELAMFDRGRMYLGLIEGDTEEGALLAGQVAGAITEIKSVKDIIEDIVKEAERVISSLKTVIMED